MKYMVMECHAGYAVLMDEESRFVRAANLHYTVGQTVTDPVLMDQPEKESRISRTAFIRIAAAAACLVTVSAAGLAFWYRSRKPQSVVMLVEEKRYEMSLNSSGEVIYIQSDNADGETVTDSYDGQHMQLADVLETVLQDSINEGAVSTETPVQIYLSAENEKSSRKVREQIEEEAAKLKLTAAVEEVEKTDPRLEPPKPGQKPDPPQPPEHTAPEPPKDNPKHEQHTRPAEPPKPGKDNGHPGEKPAEPGKQTDSSTETPSEPEKDTGLPAENPPAPGETPEKPADKPHGPGNQPARPGEQQENRHSEDNRSEQHGSENRGEHPVHPEEPAASAEQRPARIPPVLTEHTPETLPQDDRAEQLPEHPAPELRTPDGQQPELPAPEAPAPESIQPEQPEPALPVPETPVPQADELPQSEPTAPDQTDPAA